MPLTNDTHHLTIEDHLKDDLAELARVAGKSPGRYLGELLAEYAKRAQPAPPKQVMTNGIATRIYIDDQDWRKVEQQARIENMSVSVLASRLVAERLQQAA